MKKKKVGIIISDYDKEPLLSLYNGIVNSAKEMDFVTQSYMMYLSDQASEGFNKGEAHIFELVDFTKFDGVIVVLNSIASKKVREYLRDVLSKLSIPVISIDCDLPNSYGVRTENYEGSKALLNHLVKEHGCRKINYISGPVDNEESQLRLNGYLDGMKENFLDSKGRVFNGTFYLEDGEKAYDYFKNSPLAWDYDAVMCGNDTSAFSLICEFVKRGIKVPDEVKVVGFDNMLEAEDKLFSLTSIYKNDSKLGKYAVDLLAQLFAGQEVDRQHVLPCEMICRNSCGCKQHDSMVDERSTMYYDKFTTSQLMRGYIKNVVEKGLACESLQEFVKVLDEFIIQVNPEYFKLSLVTELEEIFQLDLYDYSILSDGKGQEIELATVIEYKESKKCHEYITSSIHFGEKLIGFMTWGDCQFPLIESIYWEFLTNINLILNSLQSKLLLNELYRKDYLTDTYNRYGLRYFWDRFIKRSASNKSNITIVFVDVNDLKLINDKLGHEYGDLAIKVVAQALKIKKTKTMRAIRYGGDELLLICPDIAEEDVKCLVAEIRKEIDSYGYVGESDIRISASMGYFVRPYDSKLSMNECIVKADEAMYVEKVKYHKSRL